MNKRCIVLILIVLACAVYVSSKTPQQAPEVGKKTREQKFVQAIRVPGVIKLDGILNEEVWQTKGYSDFVQKEPNDGAQPTEKTEVWIAYSDDAIYVAARCYDSQPDKIIGRLARRDDFVDSDWFALEIDPYFDHRTGFRFAVNPAGTIVDWTMYNDEWDDMTWDGVWESFARVDKEGWTVEMRVPYNQLRFKKKDTYVWGVNFYRIIKRKNEELTYVRLPKGESGRVSRFAQLQGIEQINPGRLMELMPYSLGESDVSPAEDGNPFETGREYLGNIGGDAKIGLKSNLILDTTVNPDFGQVEVDPAVINLSAYESYFSEKRPFFIEGANIFEFGAGGANDFWGFNWGNPSFFYSRRIGRAPQGDVSNDDAYSDYPRNSTILTAAKLTGQLGNGVNMGLLSAFTQREYAQLSLDGNRWKEEVEPFTHYGVFRTQKQFNDGRQGLGVITTSVLRDINSALLKETLNSSALGYAVDGWTFLDKKKGWVLTGWLGGTRITGSKEDMYDLQQSPLHYFQRPDVGYLKLDPEATSMNGWAGRLYLNKQEGHLVFNAAIGAISPGFDSTDLGFQWGGDKINSHVVAGYRSYEPGKIFRRWMLSFAVQRTYDFGANKLSEGYHILGNGQWTNYMNWNFMLAYSPDSMSNNFTRGGPLMIDPSSWYGNFHICGDARKRIEPHFGAEYSRGSSGYDYRYYYVELILKPRSNIRFIIVPGYSFEHSVIQWIDNFQDELMTKTYGNRYVFGAIDQRRFQTEFRADWTFTPRLSLQAYFQPFIAVGKYSRFKELARPGSFDFNYFGEGISTISYEDGTYRVDPDGPNGAAPPFTFDDPNFNYKSLRGTVVLRWEFKLGSTLYVVWTQNREDESNPGDFNFKRDISTMFRATGDNIFLVKFAYRFNL